jgi:hypothetical protein
VFHAADAKLDHRPRYLGVAADFGRHCSEYPFEKWHKDQEDFPG